MHIAKKQKTKQAQLPSLNKIQIPLNLISVRMYCTSLSQRPYFVFLADSEMSLQNRRCASKQEAACQPITESFLCLLWERSDNTEYTEYRILIQWYSMCGGHRWEKTFTPLHTSHTISTGLTLSWVQQMIHIYIIETIQTLCYELIGSHVTNIVSMTTTCWIYSSFGYIYISPAVKYIYTHT